MKKYRLYLLAFSLITLFTLPSYVHHLEKSYFDRDGAKEMFEYIQSLRQKKVDKSDPLKKYVKEKGILLEWNETLARVAEMRAMDMARNDYFDHVDKKGRGVNYYIEKAGYSLEKEWIDDPSNNFFESIEAGNTSVQSVISSLIIDKGVPSKGHRKHLLGLDDWNKKNKDIGIAFLRIGDDINTSYSTYTVIIIARHHW